MQRTSIAWTQYSSNPLKYRDADGNVVWACIHASTGCINCYAESLAKRYGRGGPFNVATMEGLTPFLDEKELHHMLTYKPASGKMCFVGDMTDIFGEWVPVELIEELFAVFALRTDIHWQVLTKRAGRMREILSESTEESQYFWAMVEGRAQKRYHDRTGEDPSMWLAVHGPLDNVSLGVSCENQETADERIPELLKTPAAVRYVSYEPAIEAVDSRSMKILYAHLAGEINAHIDQIIIGGESGPKARPFDVQWARQVIAQCRKMGTAVFFKQCGSNPMLDNKRLRLHSGHGSDLAEFPPDLQIREFPNAIQRPSKS